MEHKQGNPLLVNKYQILKWLEEPESKGFLEWAVAVRDYNLNKLRTSSDVQAIYRAQGTYELVEEILNMRSFLTEHIQEVEERDAKKKEAQNVAR